MFGIGPQELLLIGLLVLVIFGPGKLSSMPRDFGHLVTGASRTVEEIKGELLPEKLEEPRRAVEEEKGEPAASSSGEGEETNPVSGAHCDDELREREDNVVGSTPPTRGRGTHA